MTPMMICFRFLPSLLGYAFYAAKDVCIGRGAFFSVGILCFVVPGMRSGAFLWLLLLLLLLLLLCFLLIPPPSSFSHGPGKRRRGKLLMCALLLFARSRA